MYNTIQKSNSAPHKKQQRAWTEQELELLCERYYFEGASKSLQTALNHPAQSVRKKANALGLVYGGYAYWSKKDEQLMRDRYPQEGASRSLQVLLGRSKKTASPKSCPDGDYVRSGLPVDC